MLSMAFLLRSMVVLVLGYEVLLEYEERRLQSGLLQASLNDVLLGHNLTQSIYPILHQGFCGSSTAMQSTNKSEL